MVFSSNLGFPRVGPNRELKKLVESFWANKTSEEELINGAKNLRKQRWEMQKGLDSIPSGDFSFYDHVLDTAFMVGAIPKRYQNIDNPLEQYFAMARGIQKPASEQTEKIDIPAMEMKKWFDTNYHFIVPEFEEDQEFSLKSEKIIDEFLEAKSLGIKTRPVVLGPVSLLHLGKVAKGAQTFDRLSLIPKLLPIYEELFRQLSDAGAEWIQIDEPVLVLDLPDQATEAYHRAFKTLSQVSSKLQLMLTTYFGSVVHNLRIISSLPVNGIHIDLIRAPEQLDEILANCRTDQILSIGVVDGRNVWKTDFASTLVIIKKAVDALDSKRIYLAPSCSLLHCPVSLQSETKMDKEILGWLAFSVERISELLTLADAINLGEEKVQNQLSDNAKCIESRTSSKRIHNPSVKDRVKNISSQMFSRQNPFDVRKDVQIKSLNLPLFPTTTIGSFPQTKEVRTARAKFKKGDLTTEEYDKFIKEETIKCLRRQEEIGLDVLVHGEFERNDMVEFFGENLDGFVFSKNGWVASYGSRCVKPPIIFGDVQRPRPMTVDMSSFAQSQTSRHVKGMLTGPVTCLQWSFVRNDQPRSATAFQLALAIRDEVLDLEKAGIKVIQIDEPAIREGLPLRQSDWNKYLQWSVDCFKLSSSGVDDKTQIHTHMCYSDFNDIFESIKRMDADVMAIENSRSDLKLLRAFEEYSYTNFIGPGLYDIHSPRVPSVEEMKERLTAILQYLNSTKVWINPDCGLKTRGWQEVTDSLSNLVEVARQFRSEAKNH